MQVSVAKACSLSLFSVNLLTQWTTNTTARIMIVGEGLLAKLTAEQRALSGDCESLRGPAERYSSGAVYFRDEQLDMMGQLTCNDLLRRANEALVM
jgi:hypothetical protein